MGRSSFVFGLGSIDNFVVIMIIFPAKSREGFSQLPGRPLTLLPNRLTVAIRSKRRRIQPGPDRTIELILILIQP